MVWHWLTDPSGRSRVPTLDPQSVPLPIKRKAPPPPLSKKVTAATATPLVAPPPPQPTVTEPPAITPPVAAAKVAPQSAAKIETPIAAPPTAESVAEIRLTSALTVLTQPKGVDITSILSAIGQPGAKEAAAPLAAPAAMKPAAPPSTAVSPEPASAATAEPGADDLAALMAALEAPESPLPAAAAVALNVVPLPGALEQANAGTFELASVSLSDLLGPTAVPLSETVAAELEEAPACVAHASVLDEEKPAEPTTLRYEHVPLLDLDTMVVPTTAGDDQRRIGGTQPFAADTNPFAEIIAGETATPSDVPDSVSVETLSNALMEQAGAASDESWQNHLILELTDAGRASEERQSDMPIGVLLRQLDSARTWRQLTTCFLAEGMSETGLVSPVAIAEARGWVTIHPQPGRTFNLAAFLCDTGLLDVAQVTRLTNESAGFRACDFTVFCRELLGNRMLSLGQVGFLHRMGRLVTWYVAVTDGFCPIDAAH